MFSESYTAYLLTSLLSLLKQGLSFVKSLILDSVIIKTITKIVTVVVKELKGSIIIDAICKVFFRIGKEIKESYFYSLRNKDVFTERYYKTSVFYFVLNSVLRFVFKVIRAIQLFIRKILGSSVTLMLFDKFAAGPFGAVHRVLALFIGVMFVVPHNYWNNLYAFLGAVFFTFWIFMNIASGKLKGRDAGRINVSIIGFLLAVLVSTVTALIFSDAVRICLFLIASVLLAYSVYASVDTKEKLVEFLKIVLTAVVVTAIIGIIQRIMGVEVDYEFVDVSANAGMPGRVFSTFSNPNNFAELLLLFMPFSVPLFINARKASEKAMVVGGFVLLLAALLMTYSRSCWVGFALAVVLYVVLYNRKLIGPLVLVVIVAIPFLPDTIINRIFTIGSMNDSSNSYRLYIWEGCMRLIEEFGLFGLGLGPASFKAVYPTYANSLAATAPHSHMLYMELILEMGVFGFITFFAYIYSVIKKVISVMKNMDATLKAVAIGGFSSLLGIAFVCCAEYVWFYPRDMFAFWLVPGILLATARIAKNNTPNPSVVD